MIYAAVINGIISIPLLVVILKIANNKKVLGDKINGKNSNVISIITVVGLAVAAAAMVVYQWVIG